MATDPDSGVDRLHAARAERVTTARLVWREQDLGAQQRRGAAVLDDVVVVTDQHAHAETVRRVEDGVAVPGANVLMLKDVQLAVDRPRPIRHGDDIGVVDAAIWRALQQPRADGHPMLPGQVQEIRVDGPSGTGSAGAPTPAPAGLRPGPEPPGRPPRDADSPTPPPPPGA